MTNDQTVTQADKDLYFELLGLPEANAKRRRNGEPIVDALQLIARHRTAHSGEGRALLEAVAAAQEVQRDAISVIRTIPKREIAGWFAVFGLLAVVAAGFVVVAS